MKTLILGLGLLAAGGALALEKPKVEPKAPAAGPCKTKDGKTVNPGEPGYEDCQKVGLTTEGKPAPKPDAKKKPQPGDAPQSSGGSEGIGI